MQWSSAIESSGVFGPKTIAFLASVMLSESSIVCLPADPKSTAFLLQGLSVAVQLRERCVCYGLLGG